MTATLAAIPGRRLALVGVVAALAVVLFAPVSPAAALLVAFAAVLWVIYRAGGAGLDEELDADTLRIVLGLPRPID